MNYSVLKTSFAFAISALSLSACADAPYDRGLDSAWVGQPYTGWYDGYYGVIYDGYWGTDNYFYYRRNARENYRRGDRSHFHRGETAPSSRHQRFQGQTRQPQGGTRMPSYPRHKNGNRNNDQRRRPGDGRSNANGGALWLNQLLSWNAS